jgi:hypothetical protein
MSHTKSRVAWIISFLCFFAVITLAGAGPDKMASVRIRTISTYRPDVAGQGEIHTHLARWFESRGVKIVDSAEWVIWFSSVPIDDFDTSKVLLTVGLGHTLPRAVIELGKKSEVSYSNLPAATRATLPVEGKFIREYVTEGFLYGYMYPLDEIVQVVPRDKLLERLEEIVIKLCED